jgi:hypothetical protein
LVHADHAEITATLDLFGVIKSFGHNWVEQLPEAGGN